MFADFSTRHADTLALVATWLTRPSSFIKMKSYLALFAGLVACALLFAAGPAAADEDEFVLTIDSRDYKDALEKHPLLLGEFYAPWLVHWREKAIFSSFFLVSHPSSSLKPRLNSSISVKYC